MEHELKDHGPYNDDDDGWREAASFSAVILEYGDDPNDEAVGTKLLFKTSTGGPVRSTRKLAGQYGKLFMQHPGELPVVEVSTESYMPKVKKHGKKWSLIFKIVGWISEDELAGLTEGSADDADDYEEPAPKAEAAPARRRAAPAEEPVEEPAPRARRAAPAPAEEPAEEDENVAPAPRGRSPQRRSAAAPAEEPEVEDDVAPAPRTRRAAPAPVEEPEEEAPAPAPARRGAPAAGNARVRRFA